MESNLLCNGFKRAIAQSHNPAKRRVTIIQPHRFLATHVEGRGGRGGAGAIKGEDFTAAKPIQFTSNRNQFTAHHASNRRDDRAGSSRRRDGGIDLSRIRIVPASPSYFTGTPRYMDDMLFLSSLLRKYETLPVMPALQVPRVAWKSHLFYKTELAEPVREKGYNDLIKLLRRLNSIHTSLLPAEVGAALQKYKREIQPEINVAKPVVLDQWGRARAVGRRKTSHAVVYLVEGDGACLVNGRNFTDYFGRLHDRESATWPLKVTERLDKYNVWAVARGGGTTGQAEAITLAVAKALLVHEPALKPALRRGPVATKKGSAACSMILSTPPEPRGKGGREKLERATLVPRHAVATTLHSVFLSSLFVSLTYTMRLAVLALERVLLVREVVVDLVVLAGALAVRLADVLLQLKLLVIHLAQLGHGQLEVRDEGVAARAGEVLAHDHAHHLEVLRVGRHGVGGHDPPALAELVRDGKLVELVLVVGVQAEGDERQAIPARLGHEQEAHLLHGRAEIVRRARQIQHDATVAFLAETDELVVLADDLTSATGEVERERGLIRAQVVDIEDELCHGG
nr:37s ribosomal protein s9, mitochondrial [Quercus suber]